MKKLNYSINIKAPKEKVWDTMLEDVTYRKWTEPFSEGSHFVGNWDEGSEIRFLGPDDQGMMGGMISRIKENRPYEYISIEHLGIVEDGKDVLDGEEVEKWKGALENYTFKETEEGTEVFVELDVDEDYEDKFDEMWNEALKVLKNLSEKN